MREDCKWRSNSVLLTSAIIVTQLDYSTVTLPKRERERAEDSVDDDHLEEDLRRTRR
jgi:hypothetical protein